MNKKMLFNFDNYLLELQKKNKDLYTKWVKLTRAKKLNNTPLRGYLSMFKPIIKYQVPFIVQERYNWNLLFKLIVSSFSSDYYFELTEINKNETKNLLVPELFIEVSHEDRHGSRMISELFPIQITYLYEIYLSEAMFYITLSKEDKTEREAINYQLQLRLANLNHQLSELKDKIAMRKCLL